MKRRKKSHSLATLGVPCLLAACALPFARTPPSADSGDPTPGWQVTPDLAVAELGSGVWLHTSWHTYPGGARVPSNGLIVLDGDSLLLIDTAWGELVTEELLGWIGRALRIPVREVILTHSHHDRMGGAAALHRRGVATAAHPLTWQFALAQGYPLPDTIGGLTMPGSAVRHGGVEIFYPGPGHARDNLMVWIPRAGILFAGCAVRSASASGLGNLAHADPAEWDDALRRAEERYGDARLVIPGHGQWGGVDLLRHTRALLEQR